MIMCATFRHVSLMSNIFFDNPFFNASVIEKRDYQILFLIGSAFAYITSAFLFTFLFKRRLALTLVSIQFVSLVIDAGFIFLNYMIPSYDLSDTLEIPAGVIIV